MDQTLLCAYLSHRQGLDDISGKTNREVLATHGWARSVGGHNGYISLFARNRSTSAQAEADNTASEIYEFASARGCTYFLPRDHFQVGIKAGQGFNDASAIRTAKSKLGVTDEEISTLKAGILKALSSGPKDNPGLKAELGDLIVNYGEAGKKIGQTTNLSLGVLSLQAEAKIRRIPHGGKMDTQSYSYEIFENAPLVNDSFAKESAYKQLATLYWSWIGLASLAHFQWFSGLSLKACKEATADLGLNAVDGTDLLATQDVIDELTTFEVCDKPSYRLILSLDSLFLLRRDVASHIREKDRDHWARLSERAGPSLGSKDLAHHAIVDRGKIVGLWEYDVSSESIVYCCFDKLDSQLEEEINSTQDFIRRELGDCKSHSLDSPKSRQVGIDSLRSMSN